MERSSEHPRKQGAEILAAQLRSHALVESDHVPIICKFGRCLIEEPVNLGLRLNYERANWIKFEDDVNMGLSIIDSEKGVDEWNSSLTMVLRSAAVQNIPKS